MKKFISIMNEQSFYYLWHNKKTRKYLERIISNIINEEEDYELLDIFNDECDNVKSYIFLQSKNRIIYINFNNKLLSKYIMNFLYLTSDLAITFIVFNSLESENKNQDNIYYINKNESNINEIKLLLSTSYKEQKKYDYFGITEYLYNLDEEFYAKYLKEITRKDF